MSERRLTQHNQPLRLLDKALKGGLGTGNLGLFMSPAGTGKHAILTSIAIDRAMDEKNVLHVALATSVSDVRAYRDEILNEIEDSLDLHDRAEILSNVERHTQIYTFRSNTFSLAKLAQTLDFLADHAEFRPTLIEIQGWPDWRSVGDAEVDALKRFAAAAKAEIWMTAHTLPDDPCDARGIPEYIARFDRHLSVLGLLEPAKDQSPIRFAKVHDGPPPQNVHLEFDPKSMLIRWR